jgi:hypothetical protein
LGFWRGMGRLGQTKRGGQEGRATGWRKWAGQQQLAAAVAAMEAGDAAAAAAALGDAQDPLKAARGYDAERRIVLCWTDLALGGCSGRGVMCGAWEG